MRQTLAIVVACLLTACGAQATHQSSPSPSPSPAATSSTPSPTASPTPVETPAPTPQPVVSTPRPTPAPTPQPTPPPVMTASVKIISFAFSPSSLSVRTGTRVTFKNQDPTFHTVTADGGLFNSGDLATGQSFSFTFMSRGSFGYHCSIHPSMKGTVTVTS